MIAVVLTLVLATFGGGVTWLLLGPRFTLAEDSEQNDMLNLLAYAIIALPLGFVLVFYLLERL